MAFFVNRRPSLRIMAIGVSGISATERGSAACVDNVLALISCDVLKFKLPSLEKSENYGDLQIRLECGISRQQEGWMCASNWCVSCERDGLSPWLEAAFEFIIYKNTMSSSGRKISSNQLLLPQWLLCLYFLSCFSDRSSSISPTGPAYVSLTLDPLHAHDPHSWLNNWACAWTYRRVRRRCEFLEHDPSCKPPSFRKRSSLSSCLLLFLSPLSMRTGTPSSAKYGKSLFWLAPHFSFPCF